MLPGNQVLIARQMNSELPTGVRWKAVDPYHTSKSSWWKSRAEKPFETRAASPAGDIFRLSALSDEPGNVHHEITVQVSRHVVAE